MALTQVCSFWSPAAPPPPLLPRPAVKQQEAPGLVAKDHPREDSLFLGQTHWGWEGAPRMGMFHRWWDWGQGRGGLEVPNVSWLLRQPWFPLPARPPLKAHSPSHELREAAWRQRLWREKGRSRAWGDLSCGRTWLWTYASLTGQPGQRVRPPGKLMAWFFLGRALAWGWSSGPSGDHFWPKALRLEGSHPVLVFSGGREFSRTFMLDWKRKSNRHKQATNFL